MKPQLSIPMLVALLLIIFGIVNIFLWHNKTVSIYGLVFGVVAVILAWFVFHFRRNR